MGAVQRRAWWTAPSQTEGPLGKGWMELAGLEVKVASCPQQEPRVRRTNRCSKERGNLRTSFSLGQEFSSHEHLSQTSLNLKN